MNILSNKTVVVERYVQRALVLIVYLFKKEYSKCIFIKNIPVL